MNSLQLVLAACSISGLALAQTTTLVSVSSTGEASDGTSLYAEMSADGRWIAFQSAATTLVAGDMNGVPDVFLRDTWMGTTTRVSLGDQGQEGDRDSLEPAISADGRFVAFFSYATNLVAGDTNNAPDIFVRDVQSNTLVRASVDSNGVQSNAGSRYASISGDGRYVAFESFASNLVSGDTNGVRDIFVHDLLTGIIADDLQPHELHRPGLFGFVVLVFDRPLADAADMERSHRKLRARLADRLGRDDPHRHAFFDHRSGREIHSITQTANAQWRIAR